MRAETESWLVQAEEDLAAAVFNAQGGQHKVAAFLAQQACEKALKAVLIAATGELRKTHDLVVLGTSAGLPQDHLVPLQELTMAYVYARYPDVPGSEVLAARVPQFLTITKEVLQWASDRCRTS